jgi:IS605 OrfB family transposase
VSGVTQRTASILIEANEAAHSLQTAYSNACNLLVPIVAETRCWNRYNLHTLAYRRLRDETPLGAQMCCNALRTVTAAYKAMRCNGGIKKDEPVPTITFRGTLVHFDSRTFAMRGNTLSLYTLTGRVVVALKPGKHQLHLLDWGRPKEAELVFRKGKLFFNLVLEKEIELRTTSPVLGLDLGENNLAAIDRGKIWGAGVPRRKRDKHLSLRRRTQSNGSQSAKQLLRKVSGKERRHMRHINHVASKEIVAAALRVGARAIAMEDLTDIRSRIKAGKRLRSRLHRWAFRQLQGFVAYKAAEFGIATIFVDPAYTSQTCSGCGEIGLRAKHRFDCKCGRRAHSDVNAASNLARLGESALSPRADVNRPYVAEIEHPSLGR